jgi:catechol 2,3-dioxygenase-like lactoylglutathione lyase family enzyme
MSTTTITDIGTVGIPVGDQDKALQFFTETLGFAKQMDVQMPAMRWLTVAPAGARVSVALISGPTPGVDTGIRFLAPDAEAEHTAMKDRGVEVGELLRWPGAPAMFEFRDPDGNQFVVIENISR